MGAVIYIDRDYVVYVLVDPRTLVPFYVGITRNPLQRWLAHHSDPASAVYHIVRELRDLGLKCRVRIVAQYLSKSEALEIEQRYIGRHADTVVNTTGHPTRRPQPRDLNGRQSRQPSLLVVSDEIETVAHAIHVQRYGEDLWLTPGMSVAAKNHYYEEAMVALETADAYRAAQIPRQRRAKQKAET